MKKFLAFTCIILYLTLLCIFFTETTDALSLKALTFETSAEQIAGKCILHWKRLPYPAYYEIEVFTKNPQPDLAASPYHLLRKDFTFKNSYELPPTAVPTYYRITAHGIFTTVGKPSGIIDHPVFNQNLPIPSIISHYPADLPASRMPYLLWHTVPGAVYYELELLTDHPEAENTTTLSQKVHLFSTKNIFTCGWQADLRPFTSYNRLYWRVRALDFAGNPIGVFSTAEEIAIDNTVLPPQKPLVHTVDQIPDLPQPLYPVYNWIPLNNIKRYEVELMTHPPATENDTQPSPGRIWYFVVDGTVSCYDEYPRIDAGDYYWRIRAIDENGNTIGCYSDTQKFTVSRTPLRIFAATFGDSITHGGGSLSYSPANPEYSYQTYLDFPVLNLGRSGDTSSSTAARFEQDVLPFQPKNLLILCGANSMRAGTSPEIINHDIDIIREKCEANDIRPIFLTLMPINPGNIMQAFQNETDPAWREQLAAVNVHIRTMPYVIDLEPYFYDAQGVLSTEYAADGLHPDIEGKQLMAQIINMHKDMLRK